MSVELTKARIKDDLEQYLIQRGIDPRKRFRCLNPQHADTNPSMSFDRKRNCVHCFACGVTYDTFDLIGLEYGLDQKEAFKKAMVLYGEESFLQEMRGESKSQKKKGAQKAQRVSESNSMLFLKRDVIDQKQKEDDFDYPAYFARVQSALEQTDYFLKRGISLETARKMGLGFDPHFPVKGGSFPALIIPTGTNRFTARNTRPDADKTQRIRKRGQNAPYRLQEAREGGGGVFLVEGEMDALSVIEAGFEALSLGSVSNVDQLLLADWSAYQKTGRAQAEQAAGPVLVALDNDEQGQSATKKLLDGFAQLGVAAYPVQIAAGYKDPNEALMEDREAFIEALVDALTIEERQRERKKERYQQNSAAYHIKAFANGIQESANTPAISTGYAALDAQLDGGLYEGLYIFGAISSLGKTTFLVQMADQLAMMGQDTLFFSLEMARTELMAKSISRLTLAHCRREGLNISHAKTTRGITVGSRYFNYSLMERQVIGACIQEYGGYADHIYIHEGIGDIGVQDIREQVQTHIALTGNTPVVMIDYLQILAPYNERFTDKQNMDKAVLELKRISRDYKVPLLCVSSFNRQSYKEAVTMEAFKESGAIEYSSDVLIGLQLNGAGKKDFDANEEKKKNPREVELKILKNRNGATGEGVPFSYYPLFNFFQEG